MMLSDCPKAGTNERIAADVPALVLQAVGFAGALTVAMGRDVECWAAADMLQCVPPHCAPLDFMESRIANDGSWFGRSDARHLAIRCCNPMDASNRWDASAVAAASEFVAKVRSGRAHPEDPLWATRCRLVVVAYLCGEIDLYEAQRRVACAHGGDDA